MKRVLIIGGSYIGSAVMAALSLAGRALDICVPRMVTEDVALVHTNKGYEIVCSMKDVRPYESFHAVGRMRAFNLFGHGLWPRQVGQVKPWPKAKRHLESRRTALDR